MDTYVNPQTVVQHNETLSTSIHFTLIHKSFIFLLPFLHLFGYDPFIFIEKNFFSVLVLFLDDYAWLTNPVSHFIYLIDSVHCAVDTFFPVLVHAKLEQANVNKFEMHCWISQFVDNILQSNDCLFFNASLLLWEKNFFEI